MTEQQPYELVHSYPHFELRRYPAHVVAEVHVNATFDRAGNAAFRHLFNYISGNNTARQKLAMTAPVIQESGRSQKLAMTAPVVQSGPLPGTDAPADFAVAFVLPAGTTAETAPVPTNHPDRSGFLCRCCPLLGQRHRRCFRAPQHGAAGGTDAGRADGRWPGTVCPL